MGQRGTIEIRVSGSKGNLELSPDTYDIREIAQIFDVVESILFSGNKKQRPDISYSIESGSVRHVFRTSFQSIVATTAILTNVLETGSIDKLDLSTARAIEKLQTDAIAKNYEFSITTSAKTARTSLWVRRIYLRHINSKRSPSRLPFFCLWCISVILQHYINEEKEAYGFPEKCVFLQSGNGGTIRRGPKGLRKVRTG